MKSSDQPTVICKNFLVHPLVPLLVGVDAHLLKPTDVDAEPIAPHPVDVHAQTVLPACTKQFHPQSLDVHLEQMEHVQIQENGTFWGKDAQSVTTRSVDVGLRQTSHDLDPRSSVEIYFQGKIRTGKQACQKKEGCRKSTQIVTG